MRWLHGGLAARSRRSAGSRFDPDLVELFLKAVLPGGTRRRKGKTALPDLEPVV